MVSNMRNRKNLKKYLDFLIKGIYAGVMIAVGAVVLLSNSNNVLGAFFFSIGLLMICMYGMNLYTGKVGYVLVNKLDYLIELFISLIGNFIGTFVVGKLILLTRISNIAEKANKISMIKLNDTIPSILILSFFCGVLMYIAVNNYKKVNNDLGKYLSIFMCVMVFILCGFEHCIANMAYFTIGGVWSLNALLYLLVMILGNSLGSIFIAFFYNRFYKN